jgi:3-oxoadipate enol-lactonase
MLLHAGVCDRTMWAEHLGPLAEAGYRVVAVDLRGFGEAPVLPGEKAEWLDVLDAMDGLSIERAALVGNSFGAAVALRVAVVAPERVSALALISASAPTLEPTPSPRLEAIWEEEAVALHRGDLDEAVDAVLNGWTLPDAPQELLDRVAAMQRRTFELANEAPETTDAIDPVEEDPDLLKAIDVPTLAAAGEHDVVDFQRGAEVLAETMPNARHSVIAGAGHLAPLETPEAFRALLLDFLGSAGLEA